MSKKQNNLVWLDLEMTGLHPEYDVILEMATIITDSNLTIIDEGLSFVIHQPEEILSSMNSWCREQHKRSGLSDAVRASSTTLEFAAQETLKRIAQYCPPQTGVLCGNSVYQDKIFLRRWTPDLNAYLHYRIIDVSSVKEMVQRWYPHSPEAFFKKADLHRALPDIQASIEELKQYRTYFFK